MQQSPWSQWLSQVYADAWSQAYARAYEQTWHRLSTDQTWHTLRAADLLPTVCSRAPAAAPPPRA